MLPGPLELEVSALGHHRPKQSPVSMCWSSRESQDNASLESESRLHWLPLLLLPFFNYFFFPFIRAAPNTNMSPCLQSNRKCDMIRDQDNNETVCLPYTHSTV